MKTALALADDEEARRLLLQQLAADFRSFAPHGRWPVSLEFVTQTKRFMDANAELLRRLASG